jgi:hypothetical protein
MAKRKSLITCLLISSKNQDYLWLILAQVIKELETEILIENFNQDYQTFENRKLTEFSESISSVDLILVDIAKMSPNMLYELGIARALGKPIICISDVFSSSNLSIINENYFILYKDEKELKVELKQFFINFLENPQRYVPKSIKNQDANNQIDIDLEKLAQGEFENLCFELLSKLGYKNLEWKIKDDFIDAVSTLSKKDPDGFEYDEFWLISFGKEFGTSEMLNIALHDPEYFADRIFRDIYDWGGIHIRDTEDLPITMLFIFKGKNDDYKKLIKNLSRKEFRMRGRRSLSRIRIRWWDEERITSILRNNVQLAKKYFSPEALVQSSTRLSYEELYKQYSVINEQLQKTNELLISERSKVETLERDAAWKLLSFIAAHRLGNPIDAIDSELSNLKLALDLGKYDTLREIIEGMDLPVEKAKLIVSEFRSLSTSQEIRPEIINSEKLEEILKYSSKPAIDKKVDVEFDLAKTPSISADPQKLTDCFGE